MATTRKSTSTATTLARLVQEVAALQQKTTGPTATETAPAAADEVSALRRENAALKQQLEHLAPAAPASDFAAALQASLDQIQASCAEMANPISNFAVKEFSLQANVVVNIDELGQPHYRFLRAGEQVDERAVSRLSVSFAPLPKEARERRLLANTAAIPVVSLHELGGERQKQLHARGIYSVADLARVGTRLRGQAQLCALLGVEREQIAAWLDEAALMSVEDIGEAGANLLWQSGIHSLRELGRRDPATLLPVLEKKLSAPLTGKIGALNAERLKSWITTARGD